MSVSSPSFGPRVPTSMAGDRRARSFRASLLLRITCMRFQIQVFGRVGGVADTQMVNTQTHKIARACQGTHTYFLPWLLLEHVVLIALSVSASSRPL